MLALLDVRSEPAGLEVHDQARVGVLAQVAVTRRRLEQLDGPLGGGQPTALRFAAPEFGVAPGQAAVLYAGTRVVGGGWIDATEAAT